MIRIGIQIRIGEALDRTSILRLRVAHAVGRAREVAEAELAQIDLAVSRSLSAADVRSAVFRIVPKLEEVNWTLWRLETQIRACRNSGARIEELALQILAYNEERARLRAEIDACVGEHYANDKIYGSP